VTAPAPGPVSARAARVLVALTLVALVLRAVGLGGQLLIADDAAVGETARNFVQLGLPEPTMWNHPRLRDLLVNLSLDAFGDGAWGVKAWSVAMGTLSVPATALLVLALTSSLPAAAIAGLAVAVDPLHLDFSRQGINDVYLAFLPVAAILALLRYRARRRPGWLALAGVLLGLGLATKWSAAFPVGAAAAVVLAVVLRESPSGRERAAELVLFASCLVLLPLAVYVLAYAPWFGRGHDLVEFVRFQRAMGVETATHAGYDGTKLPGFPGEAVGAWRWFVQPIWYVDYLPSMPGRPVPADRLFLSGVANPLVWLATLPAAAWAAWRWLRGRDAGAGWLLLLFAAAYVPFVAVPRPIWTNSALAVVPFSAALVGWAAAGLAGRGRMRLAVKGWAAAAVVVAALLWPPAMGTSTRASDAALKVLVSPLAYDPANHPSP
jgi:dolichyl-phosphate-mannose-protein mannosyltransferase